MDSMSDEYYVETAPFRTFVGSVVQIVETEAEPDRAIDRLRGPFGALLWNDDWLPERFAQPAAQSGMGGGIGSYLLYRNEERTLSLSALVVPAGAMTPVHDHLAWGLVGVYRGEQFEEVFGAELDVVDRRHLRRRCKRAAVCLHPPPSQRRRLHPPPPVRSRHQGGERLPIRLRQRRMQ
jgi:predicted metal-dependent enzyme (double-stranded beta helix superfamily)